MWARSKDGDMKGKPEEAGRPAVERLGENHRRGIASTLTLVDEMLCRFERWARGESAEGVLYRERNALTERQRKALNAEIAELRKRMAELRDALKLPAKTQDVAVAIWAESSARREALMELNSRHLRRYGRLPAGFGETYDLKFEELLDHLTRIAEAMRVSPPSGD